MSKNPFWVMKILLRRIVGDEVIMRASYHPHNIGNIPNFIVENPVIVPAPKPPQACCEEGRDITEHHAFDPLLHIIGSKEKRVAKHTYREPYFPGVGALP